MTSDTDRSKARSVREFERTVGPTCQWRARSIVSASGTTLDARRVSHSPDFGQHTVSEAGSVQGGSISPLLANIYLHYVFDLWVQRWRARQAHGDVVVVRFADDFVIGFQHRGDAERFLAELRERFAQFGLTLQ
jgi:hypothetical protein